MNAALCHVHAVGFLSITGFHQNLTTEATAFSNVSSATSCVFSRNFAQVIAHQTFRHAVFRK